MEGVQEEETNRKESYYLRQRRRLCFWFDLFVCLSVCLFVCLSVRRTTRKLVNGF